MAAAEALSPPPKPAAPTAALGARLDAHVAALQKHPLLRQCRARQLEVAQLLRIAEHLCCFSVCFERLLTRRVSAFDSQAPAAVVALSRAHLAEEIGHTQLFSQFLLDNGRTPAQLQALCPQVHTRALFGYLLAVLAYESDHVAHLALLGVMERVASEFFPALLAASVAAGLRAEPFAIHSDADDDHAAMGLAFVDQFDASTRRAGERVVDDLFVLLDLMFGEWLGSTGPSA